MHIDWWTLALQAINVLILVWILARFFYRPVAGMIEQRRAAAAKVLSDAAAMRAAAEAEKAQIQATRAGFAAERDKLLAEARKQIEAERATMLREASGRNEAIRSEQEAGLARERDAMERAIIDRVGTLSVQIAQRLLDRLPAQMALSIFLDALAAQIRALPSRSRDALAASAKDGGLAVTAAAPLGEAEQAQCQKAIEAALGTDAKLVFRSDANLIAGIELSGSTLVLKNNWQNDLSEILQQLKSDDGQRQIS